MNNNPEPTAEHKERYYEIVRWAAERGMAITMHWGPDGTVEHLLGIFERVNREVPIAPLRWSIAHLNDASEATLRRMSALGVGWTVQDAMYFGGEDLVRRQGADAARRVPPVVTGQRLGVAHRRRHGRASRRVVQPVHVAAVVPRRQDGAPARRFAGPRRRPTASTALRFYTLGSAWFSFDDDVRGSLEVGKLADLAVLSADYLTVPRRRGRRHRVGVDDARRRSRLRGGAVRGARRLKGRRGDGHGAGPALPLRHRARRCARRRTEHRQSLLLLLRRLPSVRAFPRPRGRCARPLRRHGDHADVASERRVSRPAPTRSPPCGSRQKE